MTAQSLKSILEFYRDEFTKHWAEYSAAKAPTDKPLKTHQEGTEHALWMIVEALSILDKGDTEKTNRCLGFIQAVFWTAGFYTIDEMRDHITQFRGETAPIVVG